MTKKQGYQPSHKSDLEIQACQKLTKNLAVESKSSSNIHSEDFIACKILEKHP